MHRSFRVGTLALALPVGKTALAAAAILLAVVGACEAVARSGVARRYLPTPMVSDHKQIGPDLDLLAELERQQGPVDCFFIGSSMVGRGIDPPVIAQAITDATGQPITCFNFGLAGLRVTGTARLAQILIARYHPRLLVYGISFRDLLFQHTYGLGGPWADYQLGQPSLRGWLESELVSYRHVLGFAASRALSPSDPLFTDDRKYGFKPIDRVGDVSLPLKVRRIWRTFELTPQAKLGLEHALSVQSKGTSLVFVEMPVPPTTLTGLGEGTQGYEKFVDLMNNESRSRDIPFWRTANNTLIPPEGWQNYLHMNRTGATVFSRWLGQQLAEAARQGLILDQAP